MKDMFLFIPRVIRRRVSTPPPGSTPGTIASQETVSEQVEITKVIYNPENCSITNLDTSELENHLKPEPGSIVWINVKGLGNTEIIKQIGSLLKLHLLTIEDIVHIHQRPKLELFEENSNYIYTILRSLRMDSNNTVYNLQVSLVLFDNFLITFQEDSDESFNPIIKRISEGKGTIRKRDADYLMYALVDVIIDNYYPVLDVYDTILDELEDEIRANPTTVLSHTIHVLRREFQHLRRAIWPMREVLNRFERCESDLIGKQLKPAIRDCNDHVIQSTEFLDGKRERLSDLSDLYLAMVNDKTNQIMKVLTIISTIFIPLTFLVGIYGMNFNTEISPYNMPELAWKYGYIGFWVVSVLIVVFMIWLFRRIGWLGRPKDHKK